MAEDGVADRTLLRRLAAGDASALGALYDRHATGLFRWVLARGLPRGDAEDLLSECFVALVDRGERAGEIEDVGAYLFAVARHHLARRGRRPEPEALDLIAEPAASNAPADALAIREALADLTPEQREVVVLKVWQGRTFDEIGRLLGISPNTASSRYRYALEKLRAALGETEDG